MKLTKEQKQENFRAKAAEKRAAKERQDAWEQKEKHKAIMATKYLEESNKKKKVVPVIFQDVVSASKKIEEYIHNDEAFTNALRSLLSVGEHIRPIKDWHPQGKSANALFNSLANHLLAKYKTPQFLWSAFYQEDAVLKELAIYIASGNSLFNFAKAGKISTPITRQMSHTFSQCTSELSIIQAIRFSQFKAFEGDNRIFKAFCETRWGEMITTYEPFVASAIQWFSNQSMLDPKQVGPICDYFLNCLNENANYSLKGRNADSIIKQMKEWHATLQKKKYQRINIRFKPSGFQGATYDFSRENNTLIWRIFELPDSDALYDEGRRMGHCVGSYTDSVLSGYCSIWALTKQDNEGNWAMCTIEVNNAYKKLVQVRGRFNRLPTQQENQILTRWANEKGLIYK